jgi:tripartite-type tricarboxylate transporter receptor subunit TctC
MRLHRRKFLRVTASVAALPAIAGVAWAQGYPTRPVRLIVGFAPAGGNDIAGRLMGRWLSERLGQQIVVENRPGAGTNVATEAVVHARPDGYTLLFISTPAAINATLYEKLNFNFIRDIAPIGSIAHVPTVMAVHPTVPAETVPGFIAYTKANAGKVSMGSAGIGSSGHLAGELFKLMTGADLVHVPYRGNGPALTDLLGGQIQVLFATAPSAIEYIRSGQLRPLGVTTAARSQAMPDVPTIGEFVPGYEAMAWYGIGAPSGTPAEIIDRLNKENNAGLADPGLSTRFVSLGIEPLAMTPAEFGKFIADETEKWGKVIRAAGIKLV